jgi:hypothetical protein
MKRRTFDVIASTIGLGLAALLIVAGGLLTWAHNFAHGQVHNQLVAQQIYFPDKGSASFKALPLADQQAMSKYAGQEMTTGEQAKTYANHFIAVHLSEMPFHGVYAKASEAALKDPTNPDLQTDVAVIFKGTTLRSMLLNAYAWDKTATIAGDAAIVAWIAAGAFAALGGLGLWHSRRVPPTKEILTGEHEAITPTNV